MGVGDFFFFRWMFCLVRCRDIRLTIMNNVVIKGEWNSDIHMISVNGEDHQDLTVKVWANSDNSFSSYVFLKFEKNLYYGLHYIGNSARISDVIVLNSPLVMYRELNFCIIFIKNNISPGVFCFGMTWLLQFCIMCERINTIALLIFYKK